jgi:glutamine synthetase
VQATGLADTIYFGPEAEFFVFDDVRYDLVQNNGSSRSTPTRRSGTRASHEGPNLGHKIGYKEGYFPVPPHDSLRTGAPRWPSS